MIAIFDMLFVQDGAEPAKMFERLMPQNQDRHSATLASTGLSTGGNWPIYTYGIVAAGSGPSRTGVLSRYNQVTVLIGESCGF